MLSTGPHLSHQLHLRHVGRASHTLSKEAGLSRHLSPRAKPTNTELDGDKSVLVYQSTVLPSGSTLLSRHNVMKITAQTESPPCPRYFLASSQKHEQFAAQQLPTSEVDLGVFIGSGATSCPS